MSDNDKIIMWAIQGGFLARALEILNCSTTENKKNVLFTLSNITGCRDKDLIDSVIKDYLLVDRVL